MYDHTFSKLANLQIRQGSHKSGLSAGDCIWPLQFSSRVCVGIYGLTCSLYHPWLNDSHPECIAHDIHWIWFTTFKSNAKCHKYMHTLRGLSVHNVPMNPNLPTMYMLHIHTESPLECTKLLARTLSHTHKQCNYTDKVQVRTKHSFLLCPILLSCLVMNKICLNQGTSEPDNNIHIRQIRDVVNTWCTPVSKPVHNAHIPPNQVALFHIP